MKEMLANQFFMARKYIDAVPLLEATLLKNPNNKGIKRKLIICYNQIGELRKSAELFYELISEDIQFVIDADEIKDDCPCPEIVKRYETTNKLKNDSVEALLQLGILMLYCDYERALAIFKSAVKLSPSDNLVSNIYQKINTHKIP